ncbi:MAG: hypothetical protein JJT96_19245 [Opitutales bacterium]|nr:hypothetical protein [Opitutales bacterium]
MAPVVAELASRDYRHRQMARSRCPDTGETVFSWALDGEVIISPYSGRQYIQGSVGYFGPQARDAEGRITRFGGDSLKVGLLPAMASLLENESDAEARAFAAIPGNLHQQYHFAAINWARFLGLFGDSMGTEWGSAFAAHVAAYREEASPINRPGEFVRLSHPHCLVGQPGEILGGNRTDGGTENHKLMWRTSALLYAEMLPPEALISGLPTGEARALTEGMLRDFLARLLTTGNGEYDSTIYYPYIVHGLLNLYDFSPREETRALAKAILDTYLAIYALKSFNGALAGPQKRGFSWGADHPEHFDALFWGWCAATTARPQGADRTYSLHQATSRYRPNALIHRLATKDVELPFTAFLRRPDIRLEREGIVLETFHASHSFALGSAILRDIEIPSQETRWVLSVRTDEGPALITGGHPTWREPMGVSMHDQTAQADNVLLLLTAPNAGHLVEPPPGELQYWTYSPDPPPPSQERQEISIDRPALRPYARPRDRAFPFPRAWIMAPDSATSWLYVSRRLNIAHEADDLIILEGPETWVVVRPFGGEWGWILRDDVPELAGSHFGRRQREALRNFRILAVDRLPGGFALEVLEKAQHGSLADLLADAPDEPAAVLDTRDPARSTVHHRAKGGSTLTLASPSRSLEPRITLGDSAPLDFDSWADGQIVQSPFLTVGDGGLRLRCGSEGYEMRLSSERHPFWHPLPLM